MNSNNINMDAAHKPIKMLPTELCDQIAAGEVVERPSSVLKELVENSLDAGATEINVTIEDGGQSYLAVQDNGKGIPQDELGLAITRHATSKVASFAELLRIASYGFRGEALPSVASVSTLKISSLCTNVQTPAYNYEHGQPEAAFIEVTHGSISASGPTAMRPGTLVEVRGLFENVPARLKFLKTTSTEFKRCQDLLSRIALSQTGVGFTLTSGQRMSLSFTQNSTLLERLEQIWPPMVTQALLPFNLEKNGIRVHGLCSTPQSAQAKADRMIFYVNSRPVNDRLLQRAVREAYKGRLLSREYPQIILFVELDPEEVDVNVHPAKSEVRFRDERAVFSAVLHAVEYGLASYAGHAPETGEVLPYANSSLDYTPLSHATDYVPLSVSAVKNFADHESREQGFWGILDTPSPLKGFAKATPSEQEQGEWLAEIETSNQIELQSSRTTPGGPVTQLPKFSYRGNVGNSLQENIPLYGFPELSALEKSLDNTSGNVIQKETADPGKTFIVTESFAYLGQIADTYLIVKHGNTLLLLDQHAVHERILMHRFQQESFAGQAQLLVLPLEIRLHPSENNTLQRLWAELSTLGFSFERQGESLLYIKAIPALLERGEALDFIRNALSEKGNGLKELLQLMSCHAAIKAGQVLGQDEVLNLLQQWLATPNNMFCPHGRPAVITLNVAELERMFKRGK